MPAPIMYSHKLTKRLADLRKNHVVSFLRPDGKAQVTAEYENDVLKRIDNVVKLDSPLHASFRDILDESLLFAL